MTSHVGVVGLDEAVEADWNKSASGFGLVGVGILFKKYSKRIKMRTFHVMC